MVEQGLVTIYTDKWVKQFAGEAGGHRVQRVPENERRGRVHTSTVTVSVHKESSEPTPAVDASEFEVRWHKSSGKGGQRRNKVATCCVVTHLPTGLQQKADGRSRLDNEVLAMRLLTEELERRARDRAASKENAMRKRQIGCGQRGDKRRTYAFQRDLVVDHHTGKQTSCKRFMRGELELLW